MARWGHEQLSGSSIGRCGDHRGRHRPRSRACHGTPTRPRRWARGRGRPWPWPWPQQDGPLPDLQRFSQPGHGGPAGHGPVDAEQRPGRDGRRDHPAHPPRRAAHQRVRLRAGQRGDRPVPGQLPRGAAQRCEADQVPLRLRCAVQHRDPQRLRPRQQRHRRWRQRRVRVRRLRGPVRHGRPQPLPDRLPQGADLPEVPLEGHARSDASRRPGDGCAGRLVLPGRARRLPALQQVALGPAHPHRQAQDRALPGLAPDAAHL